MTDLSQANVISLKNAVSPAEWAMRVDIAACYRLVALFGMNDLVYNHISGRVPGEEGHFLINPYGYAYEEVTASSLVKIDLAGNKVTDSPYFVNPAGFTIHSAVHEARQDALCRESARSSRSWRQRNGIAELAADNQ